MTRINLEFKGEELEALVTIIRNNGGASALKSAIQSGLFMLIEENTLRERGKSFSVNFISTEHRDRILAGESLPSIANEIKEKKYAQHNAKGHSGDREKEHNKSKTDKILKRENEYNSYTATKEQREDGEKIVESPKDQFFFDG